MVTFLAEKTLQRSNLCSWVINCTLNIMRSYIYDLATFKIRFLKWLHSDCPWNRKLNRNLTSSQCFTVYKWKNPYLNCVFFINISPHHYKIGHLVGSCTVVALLQVLRVNGVWFNRTETCCSHSLSIWGLRILQGLVRSRSVSLCLAVSRCVS